MKASSPAWLGIAATALALSGCLQLDVHVKLHEDGSATITEKLAFSKRLLDLEAGTIDKKVRALLDKDSALKRLQFMGRGITLVSHDLHQTPEGGLESVAVYKIPDINDFQFVPPHLAVPGHQQSYFKVKVEPCYAQRWAYADIPGVMAVHFSMTDAGQKPNTAKEATPAAVQQLRELQPIFQEMLKGLRLKFSFEAYNPFTAGTAQYPHLVLDRETRIHTRCYAFIDISDQNLDNLGNKILENEEIMLELLRGEYGGPHIMAQIRGGVGGRYSHFSDSKVPLCYPIGLDYTVDRLVFDPSKFHYKKYFDGKPVSQGGNAKD